MSEFQFQFQYDPTDRKVIRELTGTQIHSPSTTISVWAVGFAICLVILGGIGAWTVLTALVVFAFIFIFSHVIRLNRKSFADRESRFRTVTLNSDTVVEEFGDSLFEKTWGAFDAFSDLSEHFVLQHYDKITAIPKRAIAPGIREECCQFIRNRMTESELLVLPCFDRWFGAEGRFDSYRFFWTEDDIAKLQTIRLRRFEIDRQRSGGQSAVVVRMVSVAVLLLVVAALIYFLNDLAFGRAGSISIQLFLFVLAVSIPFLFALLWWKFTNLQSLRRKPKIPAEQIFVTVNEKQLLIGFPQAVAQYGWLDISDFFYSDEFVGFRLQDSMVHVIANRAFGGKVQALEFLKLANSLRDEFSQQQTGSGSNRVQTVETGNPFQSPGATIG